MNENLIIPNWSAPKNIFACTTTRIGGISPKPYDSFNLAEHVGDDIGNVKQNREILINNLELPSNPCWLEQIHSTKVIKADAVTWQTVEADASWTDKKGTVCAVMTADCLPVIFTDTKGTLVAVAHAGWRGLANGILESTIENLPTNPINIMAWMGPAIGSDIFEVGEEVREIFITKNKEAIEFFKIGNADNKWFANIFELARLRLKKAGVTQIFGGGLCTYSDEKRFYSYRRAHPTGRMATLIYIK